MKMTHTLVVISFMALAMAAVSAAADDVTDPDVPMLIAPTPDDTSATDGGDNGTDVPVERPTDEILLLGDGDNDTTGNGEENLYEALDASTEDNTHIPLSVLGIIGIGAIVALALVVLNRKQK
jgi:hypothetical protein